MSGSHHLSTLIRPLLVILESRRQVYYYVFGPICSGERNSESDPGSEHCKTRAKHIGAIKKLRADERTSYRSFGSWPDE